MKKILKLILLNIILPCAGISQINDLSEIETYRFCEEDIDPDNYFQNTFYPNGNKKVEYEIRNDSEVFRTEYYEYGLPKMESLVKVGMSIDTMIRYVNGQEEVFIDKHYGYGPTGKYVEYQMRRLRQDTVLRIKAIGSFSKGCKVGEWKFYSTRKKCQIIANFSNIPDPDSRHTKLDGKYQEYYYNRADETFILKIDGQFGEVKYLDNDVLRNGGVLENRPRTEIRRTGTWKYYGLNGALLERVTYEWM